MKRILVPTDFSIYANKALDYAVCLAKKADAEVILLHACDLIHKSFQDRREMIEEHNRYIQQCTEDQLQDLKKCIEETEGVQVETQLYDGTIIESILEGAVHFEPELIVMGTLGITGMRSRILGSKTAALLSRSPVPVITIPYDYEWSEPKRILLALNDPHEKIELLQPAFDIAHLFQADVKAAIFTREREEAVEVMEHSRAIFSIQERLQKTYTDSTINPVHLSGSNFQETIQEYINANNIDLLVMITHRRSIVQNIFYRSMTRKMNYHTKVPLLSIHAQS